MEEEKITYTLRLSGDHVEIQNCSNESSIPSDGDTKKFEAAFKDNEIEITTKKNFKNEDIRVVYLTKITQELYNKLATEKFFKIQYPQQSEQISKILGINCEVVKEGEEESYRPREVVKEGEEEKEYTGKKIVCFDAGNVETTEYGYVVIKNEDLSSYLGFLTEGVVDCVATCIKGENETLFFHKFRGHNQSIRELIRNTFRKGEKVDVLLVGGRYNIMINREKVEEKIILARQQVDLNFINKIKKDGFKVSAIQNVHDIVAALKKNENKINSLEFNQKSGGDVMFSFDGKKFSGDIYQYDQDLHEKIDRSIKAKRILGDKEKEDHVESDSDEETRNEVLKLFGISPKVKFKKIKDEKNGGTDWWHSVLDCNARGGNVAELSRKIESKQQPSKKTTPNANLKMSNKKQSIDT